MGPQLSRLRPSWGFSLDGADGMLPLPSSWTDEAEFPSQARIIGFWISVFPAISGTGANTVRSFLPQHGPEEQISVSRCCTSTYYYADRLERPRHGSGSKPIFSSRYFRNLGACLRHHTIN